MFQLCTYHSHLFSAQDPGTPATTAGQLPPQQTTAGQPPLQQTTTDQLPPDTETTTESMAMALSVPVGYKFVDSTWNLIMFLFTHAHTDSHTHRIELQRSIG